LRQEFDELHRQTIAIISVINSWMLPQSKDRRMLEKTGLMYYARKLRTQLNSMTFNARKIITQKACSAMKLLPGRKNIIHVRICE
jgi:hypothetical protein